MSHPVPGHAYGENEYDPDASPKKAKHNALTKKLKHLAKTSDKAQKKKDMKDVYRDRRSAMAAYVKRTHGEYK
jgi:hypothetical protein